jgi:hypothetical protein
VFQNPIRRVRAENAFPLLLRSVEAASTYRFRFFLRPSFSSATSIPLAFLTSMQGLQTQTPSHSSSKCFSSPRRKRWAIGTAQSEHQAIGWSAWRLRFFLLLTVRGLVEDELVDEAVCDVRGRVSAVFWASGAEGLGTVFSRGPRKARLIS